ncbi:MAG: substrate-binding domain-containing protein, partial [Lysinibacillus sp.]
QIIKDHFKQVVVLDTLIDELPVDFVVMNNKMGVYQAIEHLRMLGHSKIGYIQSKERINNLDVRYDSFIQALHNYRCEEDFLTFSLSSNYIRSDESFQQWFTTLPVNKRPSAFFCENDYLAISVIKSLNAIDINLTKTVSVVGFDNISEAVVITPELTTIHVDKEQMAITAIRRLKAIIEQDEVSVKVMIDTKLMSRQSTRQAKR